MCDKVEEVERVLEDVYEMLSSAGSEDWQLEWVQIVQDLVERDAGWK